MSGSVHSVFSLAFGVLLLNHLIHAETVSPLNNVQLFPYGSDADDLQGPLGDDSSSPPLTLTTPFTFFGKQYTEIIVNSNGVLSFGNERFTDFLARRFPFESPPLIAPFWDDFNPRMGGNISYRQTNDSDQLQLFYNYTSLLMDCKPEQNDCYPTHLYIATWDDVPPFGYYSFFETAEQNTFQVVLGTNDNMTFAAFLYSDIQWGQRAQIGFNFGDGYSSFMLSEALTELTLDVDERSNVEKPGVFIFRIDNLGLVECFETVECTNSTFKLGIMTAVECCLGNLEGLAYTPHGSEELCHICVVFGWLQDSFIGEEQEDHHVVMAGYRKGSQTVGRNLTFTINERTAHYYFLSEGSPDIMVLTTEVRINPQLQPQEVEVIFRTDGIAQEGNVTVILELEPLLTTTLPMGEAVFFQKYIDMIIIDTDILDISFTMEVYKTSEADGEIVISVCKDKPIPSSFESDVIVMVASVTVENATIHEGLSIPDSDPYSPNRASQDDFDTRRHYLLFYGSINCRHSHIMISNDNINEASEEIFVIELTLESSRNPNMIILSRNASLGIIIDDDLIRIGFEKQNYTFTEPPVPLLKSFLIPLVKEGGSVSEQTFTVLIEVSNMTNPYQPATLGDDYNHNSFNITFPPDQQTVLWEFQLIPNEAPEENEAFRLIISSIGHPVFLTDSRDVMNETLVIINDPQNLVGFIRDIYSVQEDQGSISISVFSFNSSIDVEVNFTTFQQTALEGEDYIQVSERILIAGNQTTDINILIINDDLAEGVESIGGMLQVLSPQSNASSTITIEIIDDEDQGACGNIVPSKGTCSADAICEVSANGRALLNCFCKDGFLGTGPICRNINECEIGQHKCHVNADCLDTPGSYECRCKEGFFGDGQKCISDMNRVSGSCDQVIENCTCFNGTVECGCNLGYELNNQSDYFVCQDINECGVGNPCGTGTCENTNGSHYCFCTSGYIFNPSGKHCVDLDECLLGLHNCDRNAFCVNNDDGFECTCKEDYFGNGTSCFNKDECKERCSQRCIESTDSSFCGCEYGYRLLSDLTSCEDINECKLKISNCDENADCINSVGSYNCQCKDGFQGNGIICKDIDECDIGLHNCSENANCSNTEGSFNCTCIESFFGDGKTCTEGFRPVIQAANATALVLPNHQLSYSIGRNFCIEGNNTIPLHGAIINCTLEQTPVHPPKFNMTMTRVFRNGAVEKLLSNQTSRLSLHASQLHPLFDDDTATLRISCYVSNSFGSDSMTTDIRMCGITECQDGITNNCTQVCTRNISDGINSYECSCNTGYILNENNTNLCDDLDECVNSSYHNCTEAENEICHNMVGSFTCECLQGFDLNISTKICEDINECTKMLHNCSEDEDCVNEPGGFSCNCSSPGFNKSDPWGLCEDIDECTNGTLNGCSEDKNQLCVNTDGSYYCECKQGFQREQIGADDTCQDIDECIEGSSNCMQNCNNTDGSYQCYCGNGYTLDPTDNSTCLDNNECDGGVYRCHSNAICINTDGDYKCQCKTGYDGDGFIDCHLSTTLTISSTLGSVSFLLVGGIVGAIICVCCFIGRYSKANRKNRLYLAQLTNVHKENEYGKFTIDRRGFSVQSSFKLKLSPHLIIKKANIKVTETIGQGEFGVVYKGHIVKDLGQTVTEVVAIKTLKGFYDRSAVREMLKECSKMYQFKHTNVLTLRGVCLDGGPAPYIIMPFMANGSLLAYLKKNRGTLTVSCKEQSEMDSVCKQLTDMCVQVAKGMEYLASVKMVHRDLAARNCMMDINFVIKVADFGLSESVGTKEYFRQDKDSCIKLPLKWLAPESMEDGIFSEKSDVWAFGVTCWEIFSAGKSPYPGIIPSDLPKFLADGQRLEKPNNHACHDEMYKFMLQCWKFEPELRPCFSKLVTSLSKFLEDIAGYMDFGSISTFGKHDGFKDAELETNPVIFINEMILDED